MSQPVSGDVEDRLARLEAHDQRIARALELLAERAEAPVARRRRNWDAYAALVATVIGAVALAVSAYTAYVQRQQLRAQVWPHLQLEFSTVEKRFFAVNAGTGPARITAVRVVVDGAPAVSWSDVRKAAGFTREHRFTLSTLHTAVLPPDKDFTFLKAAADAQSQEKFEELFPEHPHALSITVCYCSVLDECWVARSDATPASAEPEACPIKDAERFHD